MGSRRLGIVSGLGQLSERDRRDGYHNHHQYHPSAIVISNYVIACVMCCSKHFCIIANIKFITNLLPPHDK